MINKLQITSTKIQTNDKIQNNKQYDLEARSFEFARQCRVFVAGVFKTIANIEDGKQLVRSSGSQAANYIEANEALSKKDFIHRVKICRKESKESRMWLQLCKINGEIQQNMQKQLIQESTELIKIYSSIIFKSENINL